ncbi:hypothetical protein ABZ642_28040 [Streptomyces sp. NPDC007157]|uniref:hypothetical protein n=1 Tax=Streptomyces sp. NPDC007157 TaxID=3154681 RepID=UPI0033F7A36F
MFARVDLLRGDVAGGQRVADAACDRLAVDDHRAVDGEDLPGSEPGDRVPVSGTDLARDTVAGVGFVAAN